MTGILRFLFLTYVLIISVVVSPISSFAKDFVVVIDAGHGGHDVGAVGAKACEKNINLGVALKLGKLIEENCSNTKVVYTRKTDRFLTLQERANVANKAHGNLFISIHTNSVDKKNKNRKSINGAATYVLGMHKNDDNLAVAMRENSVMKLEKDYSTTYEGFLARAIWVAALIYERIDFEAQALGGAHHKLPQSGSTHTRHGVGIDGRFYHRQIFQFERQTLALECVLEDGHIIETHAEHLLHEGATAIDVHLYIVLHHRVKRHLYGGGHGLKSCDIHIIAHLHVIGVVDIGVEHGVVLQIPIIHHCLGIGLETLGIDYRFVANRSLDGVNIAFFLGSGGDCSHGYRRHCQYS